ncbi:MAG: zinc ribbon domain-containing protein [Candidatus Methanoculleus thermohydrogenotrophicum]|nr:zinc ribbon domain-containing protein [Candidatus Methanoculleus thermohydrogenotrophicum]
MILVNPRNTSQQCSRCGMIVAKTLSDRIHSCPQCGLAMDRDQNAGVQHYEIGAAISGVIPRMPLISIWGAVTYGWGFRCHPPPHREQVHRPERR